MREKFKRLEDRNRYKETIRDKKRETGTIRQR